MVGRGGGRRTQAELQECGESKLETRPKTPRRADGQADASQVEAGQVKATMAERREREKRDARKATQHARV